MKVRQDKCSSLSKQSLYCRCPKIFIVPSQTNPGIHLLSSYFPPKKEIHTNFIRVSCMHSLGTFIIDSNGTSKMCVH